MPVMRPPAPGGISANWICYMERMIEGMLGPQARVVFLQGFCGDVTRSTIATRTAAERRRIRRTCGRPRGRRSRTRAAQILRRILGTSGREGAGFSDRTPPSQPRAPAAREGNRPTRPEDHGSDPVDLCQRDGHARGTRRKVAIIDVEVQTVQVGPVVAISAPGEMFCQFGLELRAGSGFPMTFPVELANGSVGYVPTEEALSTTGGGYETRPHQLLESRTARRPPHGRGGD